MVKGRIKYTGEVVELEPITNKKYSKKYAWMEKVSGAFYKECEIELIPEEEVNECVCEKLKLVKGSETLLEDDFNTSLVMGYGWIAAYGEGCAQTDIQYCPFCGKKFEK